MLARIAFCGLMLASGFPQLNACNVPVFRYALERWPAEDFEVLVFYRGEVEPLYRTQELLPAANWTTTPLDVDSRLAPEWQRLWNKQTNAAPPWMIILPPHGEEEPVPLWSGKLDTNLLTQMVDSPARRELAKRLLKGESTVWLLLESGDNTVDDRVAQLLARELPKQQKEITLPPPDPDDPKMHATVPLRIAFSLLRVSRNDPAESWLVKMLLHGESKPDNTPIVFPIFGRGRAIAALSGTELTPKIIQDAARFTCGACSCEVKELNPGKDLLLAANWNSIFSVAVSDGEAPPLNASVSPGQERSTARKPTIRTNAPRPGPLSRDVEDEETNTGFVANRIFTGIGIIAVSALVAVTSLLVFRRIER